MAGMSFVIRITPRSSLIVLCERTILSGGALTSLGEVGPSLASRWSQSRSAWDFQYPSSRRRCMTARTSTRSGLTVYDTIGKAENPAAANVVFESRVEQRELLNATDRISHGQSETLSEAMTLGLLVLRGLEESLSRCRMELDRTHPSLLSSSSNTRSLEDRATVPSSISRQRRRISSSHT